MVISRTEGDCRRHAELKIDVITSRTKYCLHSGNKDSLWLQARLKLRRDDKQTAAHDYKQEWSTEKLSRQA